MIGEEYRESIGPYNSQRYAKVLRTGDALPKLSGVSEAGSMHYQCTACSRAEAGLWAGRYRTPKSWACRWHPPREGIEEARFAARKLAFGRWGLEI